MARLAHIKLDWYEMQQAAACGVSRQIESFRHNAKPKLGYWSWHSHIEGAAAELAVAKALNIYWPASVNTYKGPDLGLNIQVRLREPSTSSAFQPQLIVRPTDKDSEVFILVVGNSPEFTVAGGIVGLSAKRESWLCDPGGRGPAYFVPFNELLDLSQLPIEV